MPRVRGVEDGSNDSGEKARVGRIFVEAETLEYALYFCVPMARTAAEAVQSTFKEPIFVFFTVGVANGWLDNCYLIWRKNALAEDIFTVALFKRTMTLNGHSDHETQGVQMKDGGVLFGFRPDAVFVVAKDDNAGLGT
jgi:hypothetical protein